ncbi:hypothetical protein NX059_008767 [Plenodomus lindquistii]|nr:hypothetical protein NX059_008767 [Plenodomus lindquistii]
MMAAIMSHIPALTTQEALSGVFGSISLASWVFLLVPQLIENYKSGSADGISLTFLCVWFIGDVTNLAGALWAGLVPTVIALAIYFCFADLVLISQCVYYNMKNSKRTRKTSTRSTDSVEAPLLGRRDSNNVGLPGSLRRDSAASRRRRASSLPTILDVEEAGNEWIKNSLSIIGVCVVGAAGWAIAWKTGVWAPQPKHNTEDPGEIALGAEILGYASAICYLGARIPQIIKNQRERSCEGLSLLFFMLSLLGNATYGAGIIFHSQEKEYIMTNLPWLIGSLGTMVEDITIFIQFRVFGSGESTTALEN